MGYSNGKPIVKKSRLCKYCRWPIHEEPYKEFTVWLDYQLERDPHREEAIQWRRRYPGIHVYNADWRRQHGVPEHLINHPFNTY